MVRLRRQRTRRSRSWGASESEARHLALELAGLTPVPIIEPMHWGIVLHDGEVGRRAVRLDLRRLSGSNWSAASQCRGIVTDRRLLAQMPQGEWVSLWWPTVVGLQITLAAQSILVDYGDGYPWHLFGPDVSVVAVAAIASIYGTQALAEHPALAQLRAVSP